MPKEVRYIVFQASEAERAVLDYLSPRGAIMAPQIGPRAAIAFGETEREGICAIVTGLREPGGLPRERRVDETALLSALITWCRKEGIPLPRRGMKSLELLGGSPALTVTVNAATTETQVGGNRVRHADPALMDARPRSLSRISGGASP